MVDDAFVEHILFACHLIEGLVSCSHREQDYAKSKQIHCHALVLLSGDYLRCHIHWWSELSSIEATSISACCRSSKAKIDDFNIVIFCEQNVFGFQVPMRVTLRMEIVKCHQHLFEEVPAHFLREDPRVSNVWIELSTQDSVLDDVADLLSLSVRLL